MKLKSFLVIAFLLVGKAVYGQALLIILFGDKLATEKFQMGVNFAITASDVTGIDDTSFRRSWAFGAFGEIKLNDTWSLQPEFTIKTPGGAKDIPSGATGNSAIDSVFTSQSVIFETGSITLPFILKFKRGHFGIGVGPQVGYLVSAKNRFEGRTGNEGDLTFERDAKDGLNRWDAGVTGLVEYYFKPERKMQTLRLGLKYYLGLTDIFKDNSGDKVGNSVLLFTVGIPVGKGEASE